MGLVDEWQLRHSGFCPVEARGVPQVPSVAGGCNAMPSLGPTAAERRGNGGFVRSHSCLLLGSRSYGTERELRPRRRTFLQQNHVPQLVRSVYQLITINQNWWIRKSRLYVFFVSLRTMLVGVGAPPVDSFSALVLTIMVVCLGTPVVLLLLGGVFVFLYKKRQAASTAYEPINWRLSPGQWEMRFKTFGIMGTIF